MAENWNYYFSNRNGKISSTMLDLSLSQIEPDASRPWLMGVRIKMRTPNQNGLTGLPEAPTLDKIEAHLTPAILKNFNAIAVGKITVDGWWELYYYAGHTPGFAAVVETSARVFPDYQFKSFARGDARWEFYHMNLFPNDPKALHQILNREVLKNITAQGGDLTKPRRLDHTLVFPTAEKRAQAIDAALKEGFEVSGQDDLEESTGARFVVYLSRIDSLDSSAIDKLIFHLIDLVTPLGGTYDGWGTMVKP
jgi:regulator of RNase E activity RraB